MKGAIVPLEAAVVEIDKRLESVERVLGKLRNFVFLFSAARFVVRNTIILL